MKIHRRHKNNNSCRLKCERLGAFSLIDTVFFDSKKKKEHLNKNYTQKLNKLSICNDR